VAFWLAGVVFPVLLVAAVLAVVLWPTRNSGLGLLRVWGIPDPDPDQVTEAVRYLIRRRLVFIVLFLVLPPVLGLVGWPDIVGTGIFMPLLVAMLIAELVATLRPASGIRVARLDRRGWRDLVPRWAVWVLAAMTVLTAGLAGYGLTQESGAIWTSYRLTSAGVLAYLVVGLGLVGVLVHLAVRRPAVTDEAVDAALRRRTARVAVGIGFGWVGGALQLASQRINELRAGRFTDPDWFGDIMQNTGLIVLVVTIACWYRVATPTRRSLAAT
jgi:hypothetical protein